MMVLRKDSKRLVLYLLDLYFLTYTITKSHDREGNVF